MEEDPTGGKYAGAASALNGAPHKLDSIIQFHVGDVVTSLQRAVMQPGGQECIMYGTIMGAVGGLPLLVCSNLGLDSIMDSFEIKYPHVMLSKSPAMSCI